MTSTDQRPGRRGNVFERRKPGAKAAAHHDSLYLEQLPDIFSTSGASPNSGPAIDSNLLFELGDNILPENTFLPPQRENNALTDKEAAPILSLVQQAPAQPQGARGEVSGGQQDQQAKQIFFRDAHGQDHMVTVTGAARSVDAAVTRLNAQGSRSELLDAIPKGAAGRPREHPSAAGPKRNVGRPKGSLTTTPADLTRLAKIVSGEISATKQDRERARKNLNQHRRREILRLSGKPIT